MSLTLGYLVATVGAQVTSAVINCRRNAKKAKELACKQQAFEECVLRDGIANSRHEFAEICSLQREIELQMQQDRMQTIRDNNHTTLMLEAYRHSLKEWPLFVPPFIIKNECLSLFDDINQNDEIGTIPVNCILTPSTDRNFNLKIFSLLEERLAQFFSKYWPTNSIKSIRFYQQAWRYNYTDIGSRIHDLKAHLLDVPTIVLSPIIDDGKLKFSFSWWGLSNQSEDEIDNIYDPELPVAVFSQMDYTEDVIESILSEGTNKLKAFICYFADIYYWNYYHLSPSLPHFFSKDIIESDNTREYFVGYLTVLSSDKRKENKDNALLVNFDITSILNYANSILPLLKYKDVEAFQSILLQAVCKITNIKYEESKTYDEIISKDDLLLFLTKEQTDELENLYLQSRNVFFEDSQLLTQINSAEVTNNNKQIIMDNSTYTKKKDELLSLLLEIRKVRSLPKAHKVEFERITHKIQEDQFSIALIGEFQGGKSTTFDALCGGREVSPRGNNIKTSSCRIEVTNIAGDVNEHAIIRWKSNVEIIKTISPILSPINPNLLGYDESSKKAFSYEEYIDLDNVQHLNLIKNAIEEVEKDSGSIEPNIKDIILIARFIVTFYNQTKVLRKVTDCSIIEASEIMVFPQNMMERYNAANGNVSDFTPKESLFAFVQTVKCYIHSKDLERLGCAVIDCPGLFASDYDTSIALDTIIHSDAVLYLLSGEKQYSMGDQKAISTIYRLGKMAQPEFDGSNVFFAINQRKPIEQTSFINLDLSMINEQGFNKKKLPVYNALLYFYAQFGRNYLKRSVEEATIKKFLTSSKKTYPSVEDKWVKDVKKILMSLDLDEEYEIDSLTYESVDTVNTISQSISVFVEIENFIVKEKAHSILIDNGAVKILKGLKAVETVLLQQESAARKDVAQRAAEYEAAREELRNFLEKSNEIISESFGDDKLREFVDLVYGRYFVDGELVSSISLETTKSLLEYVRKGSTRWNAICSKLGTKKSREKHDKKIRSEIEPFFTQAFKEGFSPVIEKWVKSMFENKDEEFNRVMLREAKRLAEGLETEWQLAVSKTPILQNLTSIETTLNLADCTKKNAKFSDKIGSDAISKTAEMAIDDMVAEIISQVVSIIIGTAVTFAMDAIFTGGIATIIGMISAILTYLGLRSPKEINSPEDLGKKGRQLFDMINSNIFSAMANGNTKSQVCYSSEGLISIAAQLGKNFKSFYSNQLSTRTKELEDVIADAEVQYSGTREKLDEIASVAKEIRENEVEPLRRKVSSFIQNTNHA